MNQTARHLAEILNRALAADAETVKLRRRVFSRPAVVLPMHQIHELAVALGIDVPRGSEWRQRTDFDERLRERGLVPPWSTEALSERRSQPELRGVQRSARALNQEHLDAKWRRFVNRREP